MSITPKQDKRHGLIVRDHWYSWSDLERLYVCRRCHARIGRPYADVLTGELDFDRIVCRGPMEHEIAEEGDLMAAREVDWLEDDEFWKGIEVRGLYGAPPAERSSSLFDDDKFEGW